MARRSDGIYLTDALSAIDRIEQLAQNEQDISELDWIQSDALERNFQKATEAASSLSQDLKDRHPEIAWRGIKDLGNVLRHEYGNVDFGELTRIIRDDLPVLQSVCKAELDRLRERELLLEQQRQQEREDRERGDDDEGRKR